MLRAIIIIIITAAMTAADVFAGMEIVSSDTTTVASDTTVVLSDTITAASDMSVVSDTTVISDMTVTSDTTVISSDTTVTSDTSAAARRVYTRARLYDVTEFNNDGGGDTHTTIQRQHQRQRRVSNRVDAREIFRSDGADAAEILRYNSASFIYIPFTLSGGMNRLLPYGGTASLAHAQINSTLAARAPEARFSYAQNLSRRLTNGNMPSAAEANNFFACPQDGVFYEPYPYALTPPELHLFWENGVFSQNTFNLRVARPVTRNTMLSLFSNYRYFAGRRFHHEHNDVVNFYQTFFDSLRVMNHGYNPHVDEHSLGASVLHMRENLSRVFLSFTYGTFENEYALNFPALSYDRLFFATHDRSVYRIDASLVDNPVGESWTSNFKISLVNDDARSAARVDTLRPDWNWETSRSDFVIDADIAHRAGFGVRGAALFRNTESVFRDTVFATAHDGKESVQIYRPEIFYARDLFDIFRRGRAGHSHNHINNEYNDCGDNVNQHVHDDNREHNHRHNHDDDHQHNHNHNHSDDGHQHDHQHHHNHQHSMLKLHVRAGVDMQSEDSVITIYRRDFLRSSLEYLSGGGIRLLAYHTMDGQFAEHLFGAEGEWQSRHLGVMIGYQRAMNVYENWEIHWPERHAPYAPPARSFIVAPQIKNIGGLSLSTRAIFTDTKPYVKAGAYLTHIARPRYMFHTFETELGFDYWSERDPVLFANYDGWNMPIYDVNLKITAHIRSFRLFYKMDNVLNMRQAYVPGYFSPGVTFRWGFNWFLQ